MEYAAIERMRISRLTLGTAQLGSHYGIANIKGKPDKHEAQEILKYAADNGINCFDTAPAYGDSEKIIGDFINSYRFESQPVVVTKFPTLNPGEKPDSKKVYTLIRQQVIKSLSNLKLKKVPIYLLHNFSVLNNYGDYIIQNLAKLQDEGLIGIMGASIYEPEEVDRFLKINSMKAIQIPVNIFDQRLIKSGRLAKLKEKGCIVFARSIFLQGLFFLDANDLPPYLAGAAAYLKQLRQLASSYEKSIAEIALTFVRDLPGVTSIVIGAESPEQVKQNVVLMQTPPMPAKLRNEIMKIFSNVPREIIDPRRWQTKKQEALK